MCFVTKVQYCFSLYNIQRELPVALITVHYSEYNGETDMCCHQNFACFTIPDPPVPFFNVHALKQIKFKNIQLGDWCWCTE